MSVSSRDDVSEDLLLRSSSTDSDNKEVENVVKKVGSLPFFYRLLISRRNYMWLKIRWSPPRLIWSDYVAELTHQNEFNITFRMSLTSFNKLVDLLRPALTVDELQSCRTLSGRKPIMPKLVVAMSLQWLAGGQWQDIKKVYGLSRSHFFLQFKFIHAVMASPLLEITPPILLTSMPWKSFLHSLRHILQGLSSEGVSEYLMDWRHLSKLPKQKKQTMWLHIAWDITSMIIWTFRLCQITEASSSTCCGSAG